MRIVIAWFLLALVSGSPAWADKMPDLEFVPDYIPQAQHDTLNTRRQQLEKELAQFQADGDAFNALEANDQSDAQYNDLKLRRTNYVQAATEFNKEIMAIADKEEARIISGIMKVAREEKWDEEKRKRLEKTLKDLKPAGDPDATNREIIQTWDTIMARGQDTEIRKDAASATGPRLIDAGHQSFDDCAVFALANTVGQPYSVVAARATSLLSKGAWSYDPERHTNIQRSIEKHGLSGFEVIFLAENFGQASVIDNNDFVRNISEGHPVIVDVVPSGGVSMGGHAVVLAQTFTHAGEPWYVMMDSNLDPHQRWYVSAKELNVIQQEKGITFTREPKTTPVLLREEEQDCCYKPAQEH